MDWDSDSSSSSSSGNSTDMAYGDSSNFSENEEMGDTEEDQDLDWYYAVVIGRRRGIFISLSDALRSTRGYSYAIFRKFPTFEEAHEFLEEYGLQVDHAYQLSDGSRLWFAYASSHASRQGFGRFSNLSSDQSTPPTRNRGAVNQRKQTRPAGGELILQSATYPTALLLCISPSITASSIAEVELDAEAECVANGDAACVPSQNQFQSTSGFSSVSDNMFNSRRIAHKFIAREQGEGVGATVRRSLGSQQLRNLDPFLMLDEFNVGLPGGFPDHPHRGFETVTYMLPTSKGHMRHEDFLGNKGELRPGDLQWMTPGRGILHAEMPANEEKAHGLQLWINLPKAKKIMEPRYQEISRDTVPHVWDDAKKVEAIVFAGEVFGQKGPIQTEAPATYIHFLMKQGAELEYKIPDGHNAFVYTLTGSGKCAGEDVQAHHAIVLQQEGDGVHVTTEDKDGLEFIVISGQPLNEPVVQYGPFVMTSEDEIHQTIRDYQSGSNGFENAPNWASDIGNRR